MWAWLKDKMTSVFLISLMVLLCCGYALVKTIFQSLLVAYPVATLGTVALAITTGVTVHRKRDRDALGRVDAWIAAGEWLPVVTGGRWPWESLVRTPGSVVVDRGWQSIVDDLLVTVGELHWDDNALDGAVVGWKGRGVFVVVHLPVPTEPMAFRRPHRPVGDSHRLDRPALHDAFENGEIPPWTARDRDLFTFEAFEGRLTPEALDALVLQTLHIVRLLDLGPDVDH
jgi:hypothetical protein